MTTIPFKNLFDAAVAPAIQKRANANKKLWVPEYSRFKLQFINRNGVHSTPYHSYDIHKGKGGANVTDEGLGFAKLKLLIDRRLHDDNYVVATIWANLTDDLRTYINGRMAMNYDYIVFKHVRGQNAYLNPLVKFIDGKLNAGQLQLAMLQTKGGAQ